MSKPVSLLWIAQCGTVLRSRWYQSGIRTSDSYNLTAGPMARTRDLWSHYSPTPVAEACGGCRIGVFKLISLLAVARRFCVLCALSGVMSGVNVGYPLDEE